MKKKILIVGKHDPLVQRVVEFVNSHGFDAKGSANFDDAKVVFENEVFDGVIIGGGVDFGDRYDLIDFFEAKQPSIRMIQHYGNPISQDLILEIESSLRQK